MAKAITLDYSIDMENFVLWLGLATIVLTYMSLWYGIALYTHRYDVVDCAWGLGFVLVAWVSLAIAGNHSMAGYLSAVLVSLWGLRLFAHISNRNWRKHEDDHRYQAMRATWGKAEKSKAYTHIFLLQGALLLLVSTPMIAIAHVGAHPASAMSFFGWAIWLGGIIFETVGDYQLTRFIKNRPKGNHAIMKNGLWRYSRHPNYFGEVATWWGAAIVAISFSEWWGILGAAAITVLIVKISGIPPLERHYKDDKTYQTYARKTSILIPLPPKN
jgi:steroid 5-alpha reductase family enzyme